MASCVCESGIHHYSCHMKLLRNGRTESCGCLARQCTLTGSLVKRHDKSGTKVYDAWHGAKQRVSNPNIQSWPHYGGRGIKMCDRWFLSFEEFLKDMGEPPTAAHSLDRIDGDGDYEPNNCRWATAETQNQNRRDYNTRLTYRGKTQTQAEWSRELNIGQTTISQRLYSYGWSVEKALSTPAKKRKKPLHLTYLGETLTSSEWIERLQTPGLKNAHIRHRLDMGWTEAQALTTPVNAKPHKNKRHSVTKNSRDIRERDPSFDKQSLKPVRPQFNPTAFAKYLRTGA